MNKAKMAMAAALAAFAFASQAAAPSAEVERLKAEITALKEKYAREGRVLGVADEFGVFNLTPEGKKVEALELQLRKLTDGDTLQIPEAALKAGWGKVPLGSPGNLKYPDGFKNKPAFAPPPKYAPGVLLYGDGVKAGIYAASRAARPLADEFAWHLGKMTGAEFAVQDGEPQKGPAVVLRVSTEGEVRATIGRKGDIVELSGVGPGLGHAVTYALEALGCRYLWPGESGKVIPKLSTVRLPDISLDFRPALKIRGVRAGGRGMKQGDRVYNSLKRLGYQPEEFAKRAAAARCDRKGNRGFWQWHGVNDTRSVNGYFSEEARYRWGHYYGDYAQRYKDTHPEWFALQPDGSRVRGNMFRPCFCMSNDELAKETARNLLAGFRANPSVIALSACLPDGGHSSFCMCEACRRLDPVNAPPLGFGVFYPTRTSFPYVSRTDRVFDFFNRVAAGVVAEMPDKKLCVYAYSSYNDPPVKVRPHPALVILSVAGSYTSAERCDYARKNLAAWASFGNQLLWRPNALGGFRMYIPHSIARKVFDDIELFKVNGLVGTDFDCMDSCWGTRGFDYYMVARALLNPDRLDFDTIYADYLKTGFGPAAGAMREWFDSLAADMDRVAALKVDDKQRGARAGAYVRSFDVAKYSAILDRAEKAAAADPEILRRLNLFRTGLAFGEWQQRKAKFKGSKAESLAMQKEYLDFLTRSMSTPDGVVAVNAAAAGFHDSFIRPYLLQMEKKRKK